MLRGSAQSFDQNNTPILEYSVTRSMRSTLNANITLYILAEIGIAIYYLHNTQDMVN